jgi:sulfoxide reductase heme-binding subunit YedZ
VNRPPRDGQRNVFLLKAGTLVLMLAPALWLAWQLAIGTFGRGWLGGMTYWSGLWATAILLLSLAVTPAATILRWPRVTAVRRMIGLAGLYYVLVHLVIYFALRMWDFATIANEIVMRLSLIVGVVALAGLIALGVTSLEGAFRRMGPQNWKRLQRTSYVFTGLAVLHFLLSPSLYADQYLMSGIFLWLMAWRRLNSRGLGSDTKALVLLTVATCLCTVAFEAAWIWGYYGYDPTFDLRNNLDFSSEVAPVWKILAAGLLIALLAWARQSREPARERLDGGQNTAGGL